jgi:hypothetical protein
VGFSRNSGDPKKSDAVRAALSQHRAVNGLAG